MKGELLTWAWGAENAVFVIRARGDTLKVSKACPEHDNSTFSCSRSDLDRVSGIIDEAIRPEAPTGASGLTWLLGNFAFIWIPWLLGTS